MRASRVFLFAFSATALSAMLVQACSADNEPASDQGTGAAATTTSSSVTTGSGGTGGGPSPVDADCKTLCDYLASIDCMAWKNCATECPAMFDAPADCADEFAEMLSCWVGHKTDFMCTDQLIRPADCKAVEDKFYACFKGMMTGGLDPACNQLCSHDDTMTHCACKTNCSMVEYKSVCAP